jgi:hypothetical protein
MVQLLLLLIGIMLLASIHVFVKHDNNNWEVANFPFVVGETFEFAKITDRTKSTFSAPAENYQN